MYVRRGFRVESAALYPALEPEWFYLVLKKDVSVLDVFVVYTTSRPSLFLSLSSTTMASYSITPTRGEMRGTSSQTWTEAKHVVPLDVHVVTHHNAGGAGTGDVFPDISPDKTNIEEGDIFMIFETESPTSLVHPQSVAVQQYKAEKLTVTNNLNGLPWRTLLSVGGPAYQTRQPGAENPDAPVNMAGGGFMSIMWNQRLPCPPGEPVFALIPSIMEIGQGGTDHWCKVGGRGDMIFPLITCMSLLFDATGTPNVIGNPFGHMKEIHKVYTVPLLKSSLETESKLGPLVRMADTLAHEPPGDGKMPDRTSPVYYKYRVKEACQKIATHLLANDFLLNKGDRSPVRTGAELRKKIEGMYQTFSSQFVWSLAHSPNLAEETEYLAYYTKLGAALTQEFVNNQAAVAAIGMARGLQILSQMKTKYDFIFADRAKELFRRNLIGRSIHMDGPGRVYVQLIDRTLLRL